MIERAVERVSRAYSRGGLRGYSRARPREASEKVIESVVERGNWKTIANTVQCNCDLKPIVQLLSRHDNQDFGIVLYVCHADDDWVLGSMQLAALTARSLDASFVVSLRLPPISSLEESGQ